MTDAEMAPTIRYAFVFPGQGSQRPGMGAPWQDTRSWGLVERLSDLTGRDIGHLLTAADAEVLKETRNAQLATFTLSLVILDAATEVLAGSSPLAVAGHSLGEYSALVAAGILGTDDGARLVLERGEAMQAAAAADEGTMAAVLGLDWSEVSLLCSGVDGVWIANDNAPGQIVIAGTTAGVAEATVQATELGAKRVLPLAVAGAFHSPLMAPAQDRLDAALAAVTFAPGPIACVANVDAEVHRDPTSWRRLLGDQLQSPVRWRESLVRLGELGVTTFVELGRGTELSGMVRRTVEDAGRAHVGTPGELGELAPLVDG